MCDEELWCNRTSLALSTFTQPPAKIIVKCLTFLCVWQACTQDDYDLCLSTSSLASKNQGGLLYWVCTQFETSQFLVLTNDHDGNIFFFVFFFTCLSLHKKNSLNFDSGSAGKTQAQSQQ